ncbi:antibiotic biosynthesis monooxygenase family protein [Ekhidna sp.]
MIAVIFEVLPNAENKLEYLEIAAKLKPELKKNLGFISIERFQSFENPDKILSLSFWESEESVREWRITEIHRASQQKGREYIFKNYRLVVAQAIRDYSMLQRAEAPFDSESYHDDVS